MSNTELTASEMLPYEEREMLANKRAIFHGAVKIYAAGKDSLKVLEPEDSAKAAMLIWESIK